MVSRYQFMEQKKIDRINERAKKAKTEEGLTEDEKAEQAALRKEYIDGYRRNLTSQLENTYVIDENGNKRKLKNLK